MTATTRQMEQANRFLLMGVFLLAAFLGWDLFQQANSLRSPVEPVLPRLSDLKASGASIPALDLPAALFSPPAPAASAAAPVSSPQTQWKVKGILMGSTRKAFLEGTEGKERRTVTEGQAIGGFKVLEIKERSVVLESAGGIVELSF